MLGLALVAVLQRGEDGPLGNEELLLNGVGLLLVRVVLKLGIGSLLVLFTLVRL